MANKAMFTNEMTDYIIESVHSAEYVWNHANPMYKLKSMKSDFWLNLTKEINNKFHPSVQLTQGDVSRKWNNLKSYYTFECQRVMKAKQCEFVPEMTEVDWKNKSKMDFLAKLITPTTCKRIKSDSYTKSKPADDDFFSNSNFESQESWSGDTGTQSSYQVPELSIDAEEEKFSDILKKAESTPKTDSQHPRNFTNPQLTSTQLPISTSDEDEQTSSINAYASKNTDRLESMVANLIEHQNNLFARPTRTLEHPEMYAFWDSIIKDIPAEALPEIKFEVTAVLHTIYKNIRNNLRKHYGRIFKQYQFK